MGCCSPNRDVVNDQEEKVNQNGKDSIPTFIKIIVTLIIVGVVAIAFLIQKKYEAPSSTLDGASLFYDGII